MTGHDVTVTRWEARSIERATLGILHACLETRAPSRTTCDDCGALIAAREPCPICQVVKQPPMTAAESLAEVEFLADQGCDLDYIAGALNRDKRSIYQLLRRQKRHDLIERLQRRAA